MQNPPTRVSERARLGPGAATVMILGAVLGPGLLSLPALAADAAGPASLVAWALLLCLSVPVAATFAALGGRHPGAGGVAHFAATAFGRHVSAVVGWCFLAAVPVGVLAAVEMGGRYVADALGARGPIVDVVVIVILGTAFATIAAGLAAASRVQAAMVTALVTLLLATILASAHRVRAEAFAPFAPHGVGGIAVAANVLLFAFAGWEAITHLAGDLADPGRDLRRATARALCLVVAVYAGLAVVTIGVLGASAGATQSPLLTLLRLAFGPVGTGVAVLLTLAAVNAYLASGARLGAALAGARLPARFAGPRRSLGLLAAYCGVLLVPMIGGNLSLEALVRITSALLASVARVGTASGVRLLAGRQRILAIVSSGFLAVVVSCCGAYQAAPVLVGAAGHAVIAGHERWTRPGGRASRPVRTGRRGRRSA